MTVERRALLQRIESNRTPHYRSPSDRYTTRLRCFITQTHWSGLQEYVQCSRCFHPSHVWSFLFGGKMNFTDRTRLPARSGKRVVFFLFVFFFRFLVLPVRVLECRSLFVDRASPVVSPSSSARFFFGLLEIVLFAGPRGTSLHSDHRKRTLILYDGKRQAFPFPACGSRRVCTDSPLYR